MASYEQQADQAIIDQRWSDASNFLTKGIEQTSFTDVAYHMRLRRLALPFYRAMQSALPNKVVSDSAAEEVYQESAMLLDQAYIEFGESFGSRSVSQLSQQQKTRRKEFVGLLSEQGLFAFISRARAKQLDPVLVVPGLHREDLAGKQACDLKAYYPEGSLWNNSGGTFRTQIKHNGSVHNVNKYAPDIVILNYTGNYGIDSHQVISEYSLARTITDETADDTRSLDNAYFRIREHIDNWSDIRAQMLGELAIPKVSLHVQNKL